MEPAAAMSAPGLVGREPSIARLGPVLQFMRVLWAVDHALQSASKRMARSLGVTGPQRLVIRVVGRSPGISAGLLAQILHLHPSTLTGILERLGRRGLVLRLRDPGDGRRLLLTLTRNGRRLEVATTGTIEASLTRALRNVSKTRLVLAQKLLSDLARALHETPTENRPRSRRSARRSA
jgi:DNA-binding MarR family transcriptional regulator